MVKSLLGEIVNVESLKEKFTTRKQNKKKTEMKFTD